MSTLFDADAVFVPEEEEEDKLQQDQAAPQGISGVGAFNPDAIFVSEEEPVSDSYSQQAEVLSCDSNALF